MRWRNGPTDGGCHLEHALLLPLVVVAGFSIARSHHYHHHLTLACAWMADRYTFRSMRLGEEREGRGGSALSPDLARSQLLTYICTSTKNTMGKHKVHHHQKMRRFITGRSAQISSLNLYFFRIIFMTIILKNQLSTRVYPVRYDIDNVTETSMKSSAREQKEINTFTKKLIISRKKWITK